MASSTKLPAEAAKFAERMGANIKGMEAEAEDMWEMLTKMQNESPAQYEQFIKEQFEEMKRDGEKTGEENEKNDKRTHFRPTAGFSIKVRTVGGDGLKVREAGSGKDMYLNFVHHKALEMPRDSSGQTVSEDRMTADGLEIPLAVGPVRDLAETSLAADTVFHPSVISRCESHNMFKSQVIDLVMATVTEEKRVEFARGWKPAGQAYVGGRGADKLTPVLFPISPEADVPQAEAEDALQSPSSLVGALQSTKHADAVSRDLALPTRAADAASAALKADEEKASVLGGRPQKASMQKGFLHSRKGKSLYPEGSSEGAGSDKGGSYARLMSRCQVVDSGTNQVTQPTNPIQAKTNAAAPTKKEEEEKGSKPELVKPDIQSAMRMDALLATLENESGGEAAPLPVPATTAVPADADTIKVTGTFPPENTVDVSKVKGAQGLPTLCVKVEGLHEVANLTDGTVDLQVSASIIFLSVAPTKKLKVTGGFILDVDTTKASFSKKKKTLTVKVGLK
jgi:hypothetical protein